MSPGARSARRRVGLALELAAGLAALLALWVARAATDPDRLGRALGALLDARVEVDEVEWLPTARPLDPTSWRLALVGVSGAALGDADPAWTLDRLHVGLPELGVLWSERRLRLRHVRLVGLRVEAPPERAPELHLPAGLRGLEVERLDLWGADLVLGAPEDPARVEGFAGELVDVAWAPGDGWRADGRGRVRAASVGSLAVPPARVRSFALREGAAWFDARFVLAGGDARLRGDVTGSPAEPALRASLDVTGANLAEAAWRTTRHDPPAEGRLDVSLVWDVAPGDPPRAEGSVRVTSTRVPLGHERAFLATEMLRLSPLITIVDGALIVEQVHGPARIIGRTVRLEGLTGRTGRADLEIRGELGPEHRRLVIRALPGQDPVERPGFGLVLEGDETLRLRLADKADLLPGPEVAGGR